MEKGKVVVTGGAGFIGSHIVDVLLRDGFQAIIVDNFSSGKKENLAHLGSLVQIIEGDILNREFLKSVFTGAQLVVHQAAVASVVESQKNPLKTKEINVDGTLNVFIAAREVGISRVVYASSCALYGSRIPPHHEDVDPDPQSVYAEQKLANEVHAKLFWKQYGLETVGLRYFNVYGPRQNQKSDYAAVIPRFIASGLSGIPPTIFGDGKTTRDFVYVTDIAQAVCVALSSKNIAGEIINIGTGIEISIQELALQVANIFGIKESSHYKNARSSDIRRSRADTEKMKHFLLASPLVSFSEGLKRTIEFYKRERTTIEKKR